VRDAEMNHQQFEEIRRQFDRERRQRQLGQRAWRLLLRLRLDPTTAWDLAAFQRMFGWR
jgi:hypothetical protein